MRKSIAKKSFVYVIILLFFGPGVASALRVNPTNSSQPIARNDWLYVGGTGPGNYTKIQDAIDNASNGDSIMVYPGIYYENQITINKALQIQGTNWATTIIDGSNALITSVGLVRIVANGDVTFQGFTVRKAGGPSGYGSGDNKQNMGIIVHTSTPDVTYTLSSNKIIGTQNPNDDHDWGFYAISGGAENIIFTHNIVTQTGCNNIVIEKTTGSTDVSDNTLDAGCWGIDPIYYMTYGGVDITALQAIRNNTIDVGTGINPGGPSNNKVTAIGFSSAYLGCTGTPDSGKYTLISITGNIINNVKEWRRGIALDNFAWGNGAGGEISNTVIKNNIINAVSTTPTSFGIRLSGLITNTSIRENQIKNCDMSFWGRNGYYGSSTAYPLATYINYNDFEENGQGLVWEGASVLNAEVNWWGDASGPRHTSNPTGTGDTISGNVDFSPWLFYHGPDTSPPIVNITYPIKGHVNMKVLGSWLSIRFLTTLVIGKIEVTANASDNQSGVQKVEFYVDEELKGIDVTAPYSWIWSDRGNFFPYILKVVAYDNVGNQNSDELKVWKIL
ncbi:MAG TPA: Ig-like domain-containing protein [Candidatus Thermoplasmatota archaeon]|nr:Ig-like domain-containing protein [Candidatus Thermoplasmatota archaeon]